jgi:hypothetical protein
MRPMTWVWVLVGLITAVALVIPGTRLLDAPPWHLPPAVHGAVHVQPVRSEP